MPKSDNTWQWYYSTDIEFERCGRADGRDAAILAALAETAAGETFGIVEATKSVATFDVFDGRSILSDFEEHNAECWGEDGAGIEADADEAADLAATLANAFQQWSIGRAVAEPFCFHDMRGQTYFRNLDGTPHELTVAEAFGKDVGE